jgi:signal transduction histidine kinase
MLPDHAIRALARALRLRGSFSSADVRREGPSLAAVARAGARAVAAVPFGLRGAEGCLAVALDFPRRFNAGDFARLKAVADAASLWATIAEEVVTSERGRIARHLHDVLAQTLTCLTFSIDQVQAARSVVRRQALTRLARSRAMQAVRDLRAAINSVLQPEAQPVDAPGTIAELIRDFSQSGITVQFTNGGALASLTPETSACLYQVVREALLNVRRHSGAKEARVIVWRRAHGVEVIVSDSGVGLRRRGDSRAKRGGFGLRLLRDRVEEIGGSLDLQSLPGQGTRVVARFP